MDEVYKCQKNLTENLRRENDKFDQANEIHNVDQVIAKAKEYHERLVNIKRDMLLIKDRTSRLKKKALKMLEDKNRDDLEKQRSRERRELLEKHLEPVVNTKQD